MKRMFVAVLIAVATLFMSCNFYDIGETQTFRTYGIDRIDDAYLDTYGDTYKCYIGDTHTFYIENTRFVYTIDEPILYATIEVHPKNGYYHAVFSIYTADGRDIIVGDRRVRF